MEEIVKEVNAKWVAIRPHEIEKWVWEIDGVKGEMRGKRERGSGAERGGNVGWSVDYNIFCVKQNIQMLFVSQ